MLIWVKMIESSSSIAFVLWKMAELEKKNHMYLRCFCQFLFDTTIEGNIQNMKYVHMEKCHIL